MLLYFGLSTLLLYLQIEKDDEIVFLIDAEDVSTSNWMRYVNCAATQREQNMTAFQYKKNIYYRTIKDIGKKWPV